MSATRTQVYLSQEQRDRIDKIAEAEGLTMAEVIRQALDAYLEEHPDSTSALARTFGSQPDATVPTREEWDRG